MLKVGDMVTIVPGNERFVPVILTRNTVEVVKIKTQLDDTTLVYVKLPTNCMVFGGYYEYRFKRANLTINKLTKVL